MEQLLNKTYAELQAKEPETYSELISLLKKEQKLKGEKILKLHEYANRIYFLEEGIARHFRLDNNGKEYDFWFSFPGDFIIAMKSFVLHTPSEEGIELLSDATLVSLTNEQLLYLFDKSHLFERMHRQFLEHYYIQLEDRIYRLQALSASEKYNYLLEHKSNFIQHLPQQLIASFLGITKETLSRIRSK